MIYVPPGEGINQLTSDVTAGPGTGSQVATLAAVGTAETVGDASHYPVVTTDAKGRVIGMVATLVPAGVSPATTVVGPDAYGAAAVVGVGTEYARNDHDHGLPIAPADIPLSTVTTAGDLIVATGAGAVTRLGVGTAAQVLVGGATPAWAAPPASALSYQQSFITAQIALTGLTAANITSLTLPAGTWLLHGQVLVENTNASVAEWGGDIWFGPTSASTTGAYVAASLGAATGSVLNATIFPFLTVAGVVVLTALTTVYFGIESLNAAIIHYAGVVTSITNITGMTAIKIA